MRRQVWAVAQRLPEKYRLVLTLRELQDLSYRQIAHTLKMSESAVETLLYRARLRFKEEYIAAEGEGELSHDGGRSAPGPVPGRQAAPQAGRSRSQAHRGLHEMRPSNRAAPSERLPRAQGRASELVGLAQECGDMRVSTVGVTWPR